MANIEKKFVYQTLEDRNNPDYVEAHGPFLCDKRNAWLGGGYYFWDTFIDNAHWWGDLCNKDSYTNGYIICKAICDYEPDKCFDLVGNTTHLELFNEAIHLMKKNGVFDDYTTVARVIRYLKDDLKFFKFEASRVYGVLSKSENTKYSSTMLFTIGRRPYLDIKPAIQICFYSKTSLNLRNFHIVYPTEYIEGYAV